MMAIMPTMAQKVDDEGIQRQLTKIDATLTDPKKNIKAATWMKHADTYFDAGKKPIKSVFVGSTVDYMVEYNGKAEKIEQVTVGGKSMKKYIYPYFNAYVTDGNVTAWEQTRHAKEGAYDVAIKSYQKALELDPGVQAKVRAAITKIYKQYRDEGNMFITLQEYDRAADFFIASTDAMRILGEDEVDVKMIYNAGYMYTVHGTSDPDNAASLDKGEKYLRAAIDAGYDDIEMKDESIEEGNKGTAHYYVYHCVMGGTKELTTERLTELKDFMAEAVDKYPNNNNMLTCLMTLYSQHPEVGTPEEALAVVEKGLERNPDNLSLWYSRGRTYSNMKNNDECIASFKNVIRLEPEGYNGYYYVGVFYTSKADEYNDYMREKEYTKQADYDADFKVLCDKYFEALPYFEKAYEIKPDDATVLEYLKSLYFRVRNEEGMMEKYNKYDELLKAARGN